MTIQPAADQSWSDVFKQVFATGVSAYVDSQVGAAAGVNDPTYNTAGGTAGRSQLTAAGVSGAVLWVGLGVAAVLLFVVLRRR